MQDKLIKKRHLLDIYIERLQGLSPLQKLKSGFGYIQTEDGKALTDIHQVKEKDILTIQVSNGKLKATAVEVIPEEM